MIGAIVGGTVAQAVARAITQAAAEALGQHLSRREVAYHENPIAAPPAPEITLVERNRIAQEIAQKALAKPEVKHLASAESSPWQSRANWSALVSIVSPLLAVVGYAVTPDYAEAVAGALWLIGSLISAYLARRARTATKPLGT